MAQREAARRRAEAAKKYAVQNKQKETSNVLLTSSELTEAARVVTQGGRKPFTGLYLPDGQKIQVHDDNEISQASAGQQIRNETAKKNLNLSKVAHAYASKSDARIRKAWKEKKTHEEIDDEESEKKSKNVREAAGEHESMMFQDLFKFFDVDGDRTWGSIEFAQRMTDIGYGTSVEDASNLLYFAGVRDVDRITYNDFLQMMPKLKAFRRLLENSAMEAFQRRDNGTGYLSRKQIREAIFDIAGEDGIDKARVDLLIRRADREKTGRIPYDFFIRALFGSAPVTKYRPPARNMSFLARLFACGSKPLPGAVWDDDEDEAHGIARGGSTEL